jgi:transcriptional regulator with XRE-family HTH domain
MVKPESFGAYMKAARLNRGESLRQLERRCDVPNPTISRIEDGLIAVPSPDVLIALVDALDLNVITAVKLVPAYRNIYERIMAANREGGGND